MEKCDFMLSKRFYILVELQGTEKIPSTSRHIYVNISSDEINDVFRKKQTASELLFNKVVKELTKYEDIGTPEILPLFVYTILAIYDVECDGVNV